jgi:hypothetical protein
MLSIGHVSFSMPNSKKTHHDLSPSRGVPIIPSQLGFLNIKHKEKFPLQFHRIKTVNSTAISGL